MEPTLTLPAVYDVLWSLAVLVPLPLVVVALLRWRTAELQHPLAWLLAILLLPVLGAVAYLVTAPGRGPVGAAQDTGGR